MSYNFAFKYELFTIALITEVYNFSMFRSVSDGELQFSHVYVAEKRFCNLSL